MKNRKLHEIRLRARSSAIDNILLLLAAVYQLQARAPLDSYTMPLKQVGLTLMTHTHVDFCCGLLLRNFAA